MYESTVIQETWTTVVVPLPGELLNAELTGSQSITSTIIEKCNNDGAVQHTEAGLWNQMWLDVEA